jgi:hypothetical protein
MGYSLDLSGYRCGYGYGGYGLGYRRSQQLLPTSVDHLLVSSQVRGPQYIYTPLPQELNFFLLP